MNYSELLEAIKDLQLQATLCSDGNPGRASQLRRQAEALQILLPIVRWRNEFD